MVSGERGESGEEEQVDSCLLPAAPGPCTTLSLQRWFYHHSSAQCRQFSFGGCQGNTNNFHTLTQCEAACRQPRLEKEQEGQEEQEKEEQEGQEEEEEEPDCLQPPDSGPCRGQLERFYFSAVAGRCLVFSYSGCAGNNNNFLSLAQCQTHCPAQKTPENVCLLESDVGPCSNYQPRSVVRGSEVRAE